MGWQLEIAKMWLYISFPVGIFHLFNQPEFFESQVIKARDECYPPNINAKSKKLREEIDEFLKERELQKLNALKEEHERLQN